MKNQHVSRVSRKTGFTIVEMVVVLAIGFVLTSITFRATQPILEATAVRNAEQALRSLSARARARAVGQGAPAFLFVDPTGDSAWVRQNGQQIDQFHFKRELNVDVRAASLVRVCMTPRGVGNPDCSTPVPADIALHGASDQVQLLRFLPMGQVVSGSVSVPAGPTS